LWSPVILIPIATIAEPKITDIAELKAGI